MSVNVVDQLAILIREFMHNMSKRQNESLEMPWLCFYNATSLNRMRTFSHSVDVNCLRVGSNPSHLGI